MNRRARELRKNQTDAERQLWLVLRGRRFEGAKFRRQVSIGNYVVDFCCYERRLVVEIDGGQHADMINADMKRTEFLTRRGFQVLRFWNNDVTANMEGVLMRLAEKLETP